MPITWKTVGQNIGAGAAADLMRGAGRSIETGLDKLTGAVRSVRDDRQGQYDREVEDNTNQFLDALSQYDSPEALEAAQESGAIDRLRSSFGDRIDKGRVRGAFDQAMSREREEFNTETAFDLNKAREAAQPVYQQLQTMTDPEQRQQFIEENADVFSTARMMGDVQHEQFQFEANNRARETAQRQETEREWDRKIRGMSSELANTDLDFYEGREQLRARAEEAGIPPEFASQYVNQYASQYSAARQLSPEDAMRLEQEAEQANIQMEHEMNLAQNNLDRELSANALDPEQPWNSDAPIDVHNVLEQRGITERGSLDVLDDGWNNVMRRIRVNKKDNDITHVPDGKRGDTYEDIPDFVRSNKDAILAFAAGSLDPNAWDPGDDGVEGGVATAEEKIMEGVEKFMVSQRQQQARKRAQDDYATNVAAARTRARSSVLDREREIKLRSGIYDPKDFEEPEAPSEEEQDNALTQFWNKLRGQ